MVDVDLDFNSKEVVTIGTEVTDTEITYIQRVTYKKIPSQIRELDNQRLKVIKWCWISILLLLFVIPPAVIDEHLTIRQIPFGIQLLGSIFLITLLIQLYYKRKLQKLSKQGGVSS